MTVAGVTFPYGVVRVDYCAAYVGTGTIQAQLFLDNATAPYAVSAPATLNSGVFSVAASVVNPANPLTPIVRGRHTVKLALADGTILTSGVFTVQ